MDEEKIAHFFQNKDAPDHYLQQVSDLVREMIRVLHPISKDHHPNIVLAALNYFHASMIVSLIKEVYLKEVTLIEASALISYVEQMSDIAITKGAQDGDK